LIESVFEAWHELSVPQNPISRAKIIFAKTDLN
jgi:hypothetical protein